MCTVVQGAWKLKLTLQLGLIYSNYSSSVACSLFTRGKKKLAKLPHTMSHTSCAIEIQVHCLMNKKIQCLDVCAEKNVQFSNTFLHCVHMVNWKTIKYDVSKFILLYSGSKCTGKCLQDLTAPTGNLHKIEEPEMHAENGLSCRWISQMYCKEQRAMSWTVKNQGI